MPPAATARALLLAVAALVLAGLLTDGLLLPRSTDSSGGYRGSPAARGD